MVCLGNICRSPMAEGILRHKLISEGEDYVVDSAGTDGFHVGEGPDKRAVKIAKQHGVDIVNLKCRKFEHQDFTRFDYIFAMDKSNYSNLIRLAKNEEEKSRVHLFLEFTGNPNVQEVPDPWYGNEDDFENVYRLLDSACDKAVELLKQTKSKALKRP